MSTDTLLPDLRAVAELAPGVLHRVANPSGEHFYAGFVRRNDYGLPVDPRIHLSVAPSGLHAMWQRGDVPNLLLMLLDWVGRQHLRAVLEHARDFDEAGDYPLYWASLHDTQERARAQGRDPLTVLLRAIVLHSEWQNKERAS